MTRYKARIRKKTDDLRGAMRQWCLEQEEFTWRGATQEMNGHEYRPDFQRRELFEMLTEMVEDGRFEFVVEWNGFNVEPTVLFVRTKGEDHG